MLKHGYTISRDYLAAVRSTAGSFSHPAGEPAIFVDGDQDGFNYSLQFKSADFCSE
jgi:hypothetical protein